MTQLKALVVDDASFVRDLVKRTVRSQFPEIDLEEAADGRKAQSLMARQTYDLVLCDWEMPGMSGLELLRWARQQEAYKSRPFVMVTSRGDKEHVVEAIREGVSDYLGKPFSPDSLGKKIRKVLGNRLGDRQQDGESKGSDAFRHSADLLTGASRGADKKSPGPKARAEPAGSGPAKPEKPAGGGTRARAPTTASIRFSESSLELAVRAITLNEVRGNAPRTEVFPSILEQAVVDIDIGNGKMARLNGYVYQLQAVEKRQDTESVQLTVRFVDDDPQKLEDLSHFIARFQG